MSCEDCENLVKRYGYCQSAGDYVTDGTDELSFHAPHHNDAKSTLPAPNDNPQTKPLGKSNSSDCVLPPNSKTVPSTVPRYGTSGEDKTGDARKGCGKEEFDRIEHDEWFKCGEEDWTGHVWYCEKCREQNESEQESEDGK